MIVRYAATPRTEAALAKPAFSVFLESQEGRGAPRALVTQTAHSKLAGDLARHLLPDAFGVLPPEVLEAAQNHDLGWRESDDRQLAAIRDRDPRPFPHVGITEELPSWERSLLLAETMPATTRVLIARHFCALARRSTPQHAEFLRRETARREQWERELRASPEQLKCWTDAVGFCDLLSLCLCCGAEAPAEFPLAHPAEPYALQAKQVSCAWADGLLRLSEPMFLPDTTVRAEALLLDQGDRTLTSKWIQWTVL